MKEMMERTSYDCYGKEQDTYTLDLSNIDDVAVRDHVRDNVRVGKGRVWLPGVYSENDDALRDAIVAEFGRPEASGYMSEECGWDLTDLLLVTDDESD